MFNPEWYTDLCLGDVATTASDEKKSSEFTDLIGKEGMFNVRAYAVHCVTSLLLSAFDFILYV